VRSYATSASCSGGDHNLHTIQGKIYVATNFFSTEREPKTPLRRRRPRQDYRGGRGATESTGGSVPWFFVCDSFRRSWGSLPLFTFFPKKIKNCAFAPSKTHFASSVLVLSNVAYIHSNSHYGKFKISSRFRAEEVIRDAMRAMAGSVRVRARYRARGGVRDLGAKFFFRFSSPF